MRPSTDSTPFGGGYPVGESPKQPFQLSFNASLKIDLQGPRVTSVGGLILVRELDERLGFGELIQQHSARRVVASTAPIPCGCSRARPPSFTGRRTTVGLITLGRFPRCHPHAR